MEGKRIDKYLAEKFEDTSRSKLQKLIKSGKVLVNGESAKASCILHAGDDVFVPDLDEDVVVDAASENLDLEIIKETSDYLVINKPAGMVVHPGDNSHLTGTVVNAVLDKIDDNVGEEGRPGIVHRLDKDTSGALLVAKTADAYQHFVEQFKERKIKKLYKALVFGVPEHLKGVIEAPISRNLKFRKKMGVASAGSGKMAISEYSVDKVYKIDERISVSLIDVDIKTGRTHQIRVHMSSIGHPVVMDTSYGKTITNRRFKELFGLSRQFLHAERLSFIDLNGKKVSVIAKLPADLQAVLDQLV